MRNRLLVLVAAACGVAALSPGRAAAHALQVTIRTMSDATPVTVIVGFDDDTPAEDAKVVVTDAAGKEVARGKTDERGVWRFTKPAPGKYVATAEAIGHKTKVEFEVATDPEATEYTGWRPNRTLGVALGVGGLLAASVGFWWLRLRKTRREGMAE
jgi:nickel transport protein